MSNKLKNTVNQKNEPSPQDNGEEVVMRKVVKKKSLPGKIMSFFFGGQFLEDKKNVHLLYFLFFLSALFIVYIYYGYWSEKLIRKANRLQKELNEQRSEYIYMTGECMFLKKQSQLAERAKAAGIYMSVTPPIILLTDSSYIEKK
jgi:cell division protein FtsL